MFQYFFSDCGTPTEDTGYLVVSYSLTTYESISTMTCDTGYEGSAFDITCEAGGSWSNQTGCTIVGWFYYVFLISNMTGFLAV